jgi:hypothetical protein
MAERSVLRELVTLLGFDIDEKALKTYELRIAEMRKHLRRFAIAAGIAGAAITGIAVKTARAGDNIVKTSNRLGLSIKALQEWRFVAERSGVAAATFDMAMQRFGRRAAEAARGTGEAVKALVRLRVQTKNANGEVRSMDELLEDALKALAEIESPLERNALAMKLFDSEGVRVVQMLEGGVEGIDKLRGRFRQLGGAMDEQTAKLGVEAMDAWTDFRAAINGIIYAMGKVLLPILTKFLLTVSEWLAKNQKLVATIGWITIGVIALSAAVFAGLAVWKLWAAAIAIVNVGLLLMIAKLVAIVALIGAFALLAQDIALFMRGDADTVTGRVVEGLKAAVARAIDFWKNLIVEFITKVIPENLRNVITDAFNAILALWNRFVTVIRTTLSQAIDAVIPPEVRALLRRAAATPLTATGAVTAQAEADKARLARAAQRFAATIPGREGAGSAAQTVNINITQQPGESARGLTARLAEGLLEKRVAVPLNAIAP